MPNLDLMTLLPLLTGGKNADINTLLSAMGASQSAAPPPEPTEPKVPRGRRPDYAKLYPDTPIGELPRADGHGGSKPDLASILQLVTALNAGKQRSYPQPQQPDPPVAPLAPRDIRSSLRTILDMNALEKNAQSAARPSQEPHRPYPNP